MSVSLILYRYLCKLIVSQNNVFEKTTKKVVIDKESSSEEENEQVSARRSTRDRRPTEQYRHRDLDIDEESN